MYCFKKLRNPTSVLASDIGGSRGSKGLIKTLLFSHQLSMLTSFSGRPSSPSMHPGSSRLTSSLQLTTPDKRSPPASILHPFCTRTHALFGHTGTSEPITMSRRLRSCTPLELGDWQFHLEEEGGACYQKRGNGMEAGKGSRYLLEIPILYVFYIFYI